jgi:hypothetical protein
VLIGPSLGVALVLGLVLPSRDPTGRWDDQRLLLGAFTVLPLAVVLLVSLVSRANLNWAAPAHVAGCILAVAWALRAGRHGPLARAVALNVALGLALYGALVAVPEVQWRGSSLPVAARFHGWGELGRRVAARAAQLGDARVLTDLRELLPIAGYYGRVSQSRLVEWNPSGVPHSHFQAQTRLEPGDPGPWLYVSYRPRPAGVTNRFAQVDLIDVVTVEIGPGLTRTHWLFALRDFRGYPTAQRAAVAASPPPRPPPSILAETLDHPGAPSGQRAWTAAQRSALPRPAPPVRGASSAFPGSESSESGLRAFTAARTRSTNCTQSVHSCVVSIASALATAGSQMASASGCMSTPTRFMIRRVSGTMSLC